jgi:hypothetical protein
MKNLLIKLASKIIHKYGVFEINLNSKIKVFDEIIYITNLTVNKSINHATYAEIKAEQMYTFTCT